MLPILLLAAVNIGRSWPSLAVMGPMWRGVLQAALVVVGVGALGGGVAAVVAARGRRSSDD